MDDAPARELVALLDLENLGDDRFRGHSPHAAGRHLYGGQVVAQALVATTRTTPADRPLHSLHAYFVLAGDPQVPIDFAVERIRDGRSFTTRRCVASQQKRTIFSLEASFQLREQGFEHAADMPQTPDPESLAPINDLVERFRGFLPLPAEHWLKRATSVDMRIAAPETLIAPNRLGQFIWFRVQGPLPDDEALHAALLAYLSDMTLLNTALMVHGRNIFDAKIQVASLDHALWIHHPPRVDQWLLYAQESPAASNARGLTFGRIFTRDGRLLASVAQEGLIRLRTNI
ncbi:acyl-CoA thioesterase [Methylocystis parvus]|uniref:Acyl-CoA thioesterase 2 n=1 Tax=Methylocystis parvus TaxID=134 RepID=A0A6B8MA95_9HYPH|nr:acyl-CoA thioesterase II [Methylocystis parvus]QGM98672.1 acyl-CoA thioesterase II [Methylocystis parvus]WBK00980.1 acyl-CoA thioesterase II [Methylocystis parvus OBBP]